MSLAAMQLERHVLDGMHDAAFDLEVDGDVLRIEDQLAALRTLIGAVGGKFGHLNTGPLRRAARRRAR